MQGVSSALIARNESWVRQQAAALLRHLPSNVEKADLIQAGLIAVAQSALSFQWEGDHDSPEAREAFVRYARMRVKGAMLDELRQMDVLQRAQRRKIKALQIARERWRASHGAEATLGELAARCQMSIDEIASLDHAAELAHSQVMAAEREGDDLPHSHHPATPQDEVEARVDTAIVMRRLEKFFAQLPERDRQVIDAYLGVGLTPVELADQLSISPSRISQLYKSLLHRIAHQLGFAEQRALDRLREMNEAEAFERKVAEREAALATQPEAGPWGELMEAALTSPRFGEPDEGHISVGSDTRWG